MIAHMRDNGTMEFEKQKLRENCIKKLAALVFIHILKQ